LQGGRRNSSIAKHAKMRQSVVRLSRKGLEKSLARTGVNLHYSERRIISHSRLRRSLEEWYWGREKKSKSRKSPKWNKHQGVDMEKRSRRFFKKVQGWTRRGKRVNHLERESWGGKRKTVGRKALHH